MGLMREDIPNLQEDNKQEEKKKDEKKHQMRSYRKKDIWVNSNEERSSSGEEHEEINLSLMEIEDEGEETQEEDNHVHLQKKIYVGLWYLDSCFSKHMTDDLSKFTKLEMRNGGNVTLSDNSQKKIIGVDTIIMCSILFIENVLLVEGLE